MAGPQEIKKPSIQLYADPGCSTDYLQEIMLGMEEEGIPWEFTETSGKAIELAFSAAQNSNLEVGVGIDSENIVLHYKKLKPEEPLFQVPTYEGAAVARNVGSNAARLVKKLPLKI